MSVSDATLALRAAVGLQVNGAFDAQAADMSHDGQLNIQDITLVLRAALGAG